MLRCPVDFTGAAHCRGPPQHAQAPPVCQGPAAACNSAPGVPLASRPSRRGFKLLYLPAMRDAVMLCAAVCALKSCHPTHCPVLMCAAQGLNNHSKAVADLQAARGILPGDAEVRLQVAASRSRQDAAVQDVHTQALACVMQKCSRRLVDGKHKQLAQGMLQLMHRYRGTCSWCCLVL